MRIFSSAFVIIGVIIGAGFASGKEIYSFFLIYGKNGIIGMVISIGIIGFLIYKSLTIIKENNINTYQEWIGILIPSGKNKKRIEQILNIIINGFMLITFYVMCAGFTAYFKQEFGTNEVCSGVILAALSYKILNKNLNAIYVLNTIIIPLIIIILLLLGIKSIEQVGSIETVNSTSIWTVKSILYASYNTITLTLLLIPMKKYIKRKNDITKITTLSISIIMILSITICMILLTLKSDVSKIELPAVYASSNFR